MVRVVSAEPPFRDSLQLERGPSIIARVSVQAILLAAVAGTGVPSDLELHWSAPPECPGRDVIESHISATLAEQTDTRAVDAEGVVVAKMVDKGSSYALELTIETSDYVATRQIRSSDCERLARATALVVAVALDAASTAEHVDEAMDAEDDPAEGDPFVPDVAEKPAEVPPAVHQPESEQEEEEAPELPKGPLIDGALRLFGGVDSGVLPGASGGIGLGLALTGPLWRVGIEASRWFPKSAFFEGEPDVGGVFDLWAAGVRGCFVPAFDRLEVPLCLGGEAGRLRAVGTGGTVNLTRQPVWAAAVVAPGVIWLPRPWIGLFGGFDGFINVARPEFTGQNRPLLHQPTSVTVRALVGVEVRAGRRATPRRDHETARRRRP